MFFDFKIVVYVDVRAYVFDVRNVLFFWKCQACAIPCTFDKNRPRDLLPFDKFFKKIFVSQFIYLKQTISVSTNLHSGTVKNRK